MNTETGLEKLREALADRCKSDNEPGDFSVGERRLAWRLSKAISEPRAFWKDGERAAELGYRSRDGEVAEKDDLLVGSYLHALDTVLHCTSCDGSGQDDDGEHFINTPCPYCQGPRALMGSIWTNLSPNTQASVRALLDLENGDTRIAFYELWGKQAIRDEKNGQKVEFYKPPALAHKEEIDRLTQEKAELMGALEEISAYATRNSQSSYEGWLGGVEGLADAALAKSKGQS